MASESSLPPSKNQPLSHILSQISPFHAPILFL
jgi:hypothetical protein